MHAVILAFLQVIFNGGALNSSAKVESGFAETQLTADCATVIQADWTAMGWDIEPLEEAASESQSGDVCRVTPEWPAESL